jgi:excisionase family DNA binding protein
LGGGLLDVADVCAALKISRPTLYRLLKAGKLPAGLQVGTRLRWSRAAIETFVTGSAA